MTLRLLICGSRDFEDDGIIHAVLTGYMEETGGDLVIIEGAAPGADSIAGRWADHWAVKHLSIPAKWQEHDRGGRTKIRCSCPKDAIRCPAAGPRRNQAMLDLQPDLVIGFSNKPLVHSRGTADMLRRAHRAGIRNYVVEGSPPDAVQQPLL